MRLVSGALLVLFSLGSIGTALAQDECLKCKQPLKYIRL
jgi:hypothetical protein